MSFILDALRKSENERREQSTPTLAATPQAAPVRKKNIWLPVIAIILTLNVIVIAALLLMRDAQQPGDAEPRPAEPVVSAPPPVTPAPQPVAPVTESAPQATGPAATPAPTPVPTVAAPPPRVTIAPLDEPAAPPPAEPLDEPTVQTIQNALPTFAQLKTIGAISSPNLRIDMHVYSQDPAKRMVFINMSKYREGDQLAEGPELVEITPEGAIMVQQGQKFRLDRE